MDIPGNPLTRVTKPLRCTSLHQSTLAVEPAFKSSSLTFDTSDYSDSQDSQDVDALGSNDSSEEDSMRVGPVEDFKMDTMDLRRNSTPHERRLRRASSGNSLRPKHKGLSLNYTSPTTTARAINDVFSKRDTTAEDPAHSRSPEADRVNFLAELPDAIARARKVHYRREALLPKTKSFTRVQKSLQEDNAPFEVDLKKEATLAGILKQKSVDSQATSALEEVKEVADKIVSRDTLIRSPFVDSVGSAESTGATDKDDTLFSMEDPNTATLKSIGSGEHSTEVLGTHDQRGAKAFQRSGRPGKRKNDEARYVPYNTSFNKRRAISPSPSRPLGSPNVQGSIFRIEDLSL